MFIIALTGVVRSHGAAEQELQVTGVQRRSCGLGADVCRGMRAHAAQKRGLKCGWTLEHLQWEGELNL